MSWRQRRQAARQRREAILKDLRERGWRSFLADRGQQVKQVVAQAPGRAFAAGKKAAQHVLAIQQAAGLSEKLTRRSALSVVADHEPRHQSAQHHQWQQGYADVVRAKMPGILPDPPRPREWFEVNPHTGSERDDPELEA